MVRQKVLTHNYILGFSMVLGFRNLPMAAGRVFFGLGSGA